MCLCLTGQKYSWCFFCSFSQRLTNNEVFKCCLLVQQCCATEACMAAMFAWRLGDFHEYWFSIHFFFIKWKGAITPGHVSFQAEEQKVLQYLLPGH